jgi:signal peptidase II
MHSGPIVASDPAGAAPTAPVAWARWFWPAAIPLLVVDLLSKEVIFHLYRVGEQPYQGIWLAFNPGVAWSIGHRVPWLVAVVTLILIPALTWYWYRFYRTQGRCENLAFGLILGGAVGNAYDRVLSLFGRLGGVRDFIHVDLGFPPFDPWPTFNLADSGICVGFALLLLLSLRKPAAKVS